jgi:ribonuclease BN (tRNA processing enzyme)
LRIPEKNGKLAEIPESAKLNIRFLGTHSAESRQSRLVSLVIDDILAIDAGSLTSELTLQEQRKIKAILLSHGHYDHIRSVPAFAFNNSERTTPVYGTSQTLEILSSHLVDDVIYPDFTSDNSFLKKSVLELVVVEPDVSFHIEGYTITPIPVQHSLRAVGFSVNSGDNKIVFFTGDTGPGISHVWDLVSPQLLIADVTWSNAMADVSREAGHLCPSMLQAEMEEMRRIKNYLPQVVAIHMNPEYEAEIEQELAAVAESLGTGIEIAREGDYLSL